jgi:hypothetical protein
VAVDVTSVFADYFARNRGPVPGDPDARQMPNYGVSANLNGATVGLTLTFHSGCEYCCCEWGCHLNLQEGKRWGWLRRELSAGGLVPADRLELRLAVIVEAGALFFDLSRPDPARRGQYAFTTTEAHQYQVTVTEGVGEDA